MADAVGVIPDSKPPPNKIPEPGHALTPPTSEEGNKRDGSPEDAYSDLDLNDDDVGGIEPAFYYEGGKIPVFKPTMRQFQSFSKFIGKVNKYGMKAGIIKVIPPPEWTNELPYLDEAVKSIKIRNPISQDFAGTHGTYTQANIEKQRSYNLPQWKALAEEPQHQPPAKRGERRQGHPKQPATPRSKRSSNALSERSAQATTKRGPGRPRKHPSAKMAKSYEERSSMDTIRKESVVPRDSCKNLILSQDSPLANAQSHHTEQQELITGENPSKAEKEDQGRKKSKNSGKVQSKGQATSVSERRKYNQRETAEKIDESAFQNFDYRVHNQDEYTPERCAELETAYWKSLTFASPMYAADMPGSLFPETTKSWNVAKLDNLLDVIGQKVPGVNTAYLYLGMWKATFAWHLEDVDLYSINYIHFGAPKQWYSISQEDARRFEVAMKSIWPSDAKNCSQFLRHKTYLVSPTLLQNQFNIRVNKLVHYEGEFVITFPYGYHSGYNIGYNCAESVNFATEDWLEYGKLAKKCNCEADSVWIDAHYIERKLRGEPSPEYYEETDDEAIDYTDLPSPPASVKGAAKSGTKRKRELADITPRIKRIKIRVKKSLFEPCILCPNNPPNAELLPTDNGRRAHVVCAEYTPETYIWDVDGVKTICDVDKIGKARMDLKCSFCRSKKGACVQCSQKKCTRAFHATCAAAAGVRVDSGKTPQYLPDDNTEYYVEDHDFRCRFHRNKRPKQHDSESLEKQYIVYHHAASLRKDDVIQMQYHNGEIFAGVVQENRPSEQAVIVKVLQYGDVVEVDWKWILTHEESDSQLTKASVNAKPLPADVDKDIVQARNENGPPQPDDPFYDPLSRHKWQEFHVGPSPRNPFQTPVNLSLRDKVWYYLGSQSTHAYDRFTNDLSNAQPNPASNFLASVAPYTPSRAVNSSKHITLLHNQGSKNPNPQTANTVVYPGSQRTQNQYVTAPGPRPYVYKPKPDVWSQSTDAGTRNIASGSAFQRTKLSNPSNIPTERATINDQSPSKMEPTAVTRRDSNVYNTVDETLLHSSVKVSSSGAERVGALSHSLIPKDGDQSRSQWQNDSQTANRLGIVAHHAQNLPLVNQSHFSSTHASRTCKYKYLLNSLLRRTAHLSPYNDQRGYSQAWMRQSLDGHPFSNDTSRSSSLRDLHVESASKRQPGYQNAPGYPSLSSTLTVSPVHEFVMGLNHIPQRPPVSPILQEDSTSLT